MIYHYFGDKDALYLAVLEDAYRHIRHTERRLDLTRKPPSEGLRELALSPGIISSITPNS